MPHLREKCVCNERRGIDAKTNVLLRRDPTRTTMLQKRLLRRLQAIFRQVNVDIWKFLVVQDALGLKQRKHFFNFDRLINQAQEREFEFRTSAGKLEAFNQWFATQVAARLATPLPGTPVDRPWLTEYVESAYRQGLVNAFLASRSKTDRAEFLRSSFAGPEARSKMELLATRSFELLKGVTATMAVQMNFILAQGILDGRGPAAIAREMQRKITHLSRTQAFRIARTEIIHAHAEGQLDSFQRLGVERLGVRVEWLTAGDDRVCPVCAFLEGKTFTIAQARGKIPMHPNCRCSWIPSIPVNQRR